MDSCFRRNGCYPVAVARHVTTPAKAGVYRPLLCGAPPPLDSCFRRNGCYTVEAAPLTTPLPLVWFDKPTTNGVGLPTMSRMSLV